MTATEYLNSYGVVPRLKPDGSLSLSGMKGLSENLRAEIITWAKNNREIISEDLTGDQKGHKGADPDPTEPTAVLLIEPMEFCLHRKKCCHLDAPGGDTRPVCKKTDQAVFDINRCPAGKWFVA